MHRVVYVDIRFMQPGSSEVSQRDMQFSVFGGEIFARPEPGIYRQERLYFRAAIANDFISMKHFSLFLSSKLRKRVLVYMHMYRSY